MTFVRSIHMKIGLLFLLFRARQPRKSPKGLAGRDCYSFKKRFTYEEAQQVITQQQGDFCKELIILNRLAKQMRNERFKQGAINFETVEVKFQLDAQGTPLRVLPKVWQDTHKLVEEFMLLANMRIATRVSKMHQGKDLPTLCTEHTTIPTQTN